MSANQPSASEIMAQLLQIRAVCRRQTQALQDGRNHVALLETEMIRQRNTMEGFLTDTITNWHDAKRLQRIADQAAMEAVAQLDAEKDRNRRLRTRFAFLRLRLRSGAEEIAALRREHSLALAEKDRQITDLAAAVAEARQRLARRGSDG